MLLKDETMMVIGIISLALGIFIGRFVYMEYYVFSIFDLVEGIFIGLILVMNIAYLIRTRSKKQ